jgi:putative endonuclease
MRKQPCVYILASQRYGTIYIGVTSDLLARLCQHRTGATPGFTSRYEVWRLMRFEFFADMASATAREKQLKNWHRDWKINLIESENPEWVDLAVTLGLEPVPVRPRPDGPWNKFWVTEGGGADGPHHIRNTPNAGRSGIGALRVAARASPSTSRVCAGSIMPSSHRRAVACQGLPSSS